MLASRSATLSLKETGHAAGKNTAELLLALTCTISEDGDAPEPDSTDSESCALEVVFVPLVERRETQLTPWLPLYAPSVNHESLILSEEEVKILETELEAVHIDPVGK